MQCVFWEVRIKSADFFLNEIYTYEDLRYTALCQQILELVVQNWA